MLKKFKLKPIKLVLNGKTISLTGDNINIDSNNFSVDEEGNMICKNANVSGTITTGGDENFPEFKSIAEGRELSIYPCGINMEDEKGTAYMSTNTLQISSDTLTNGGLFYTVDGSQFIIYSETGNQMIFLANSSSTIRNGNNDTALQLADDGAYFKGGNNVYINGYRVLTSTSDEKLKNNIKETNITALDLIKRISHKQFDWKENNYHQSIGYIAQELEKINKDFVVKDNIKDENNNNIDGKYNYQVNILPLLATTTKAMQELSEKVEQLQKEVKELKGGQDK